MIFKEIDNIRDVGVICHYFRNYHVFEYSATNINRRVRRDVKICLITST